MTVTRAFKKAMAHFQEKGIDAWSWALVDDNACKVVYVNVYNGSAGKKWTPKEHDFTDEAQLAKKLKGYEAAVVGDCPVSI